MERILFILAGVNGFLAVALGAFGAHGLKTRLAELPDSAQRLAWWETASHYHLTHALAIGLVAALIGRFADSAPTSTTVAGVAFNVGILIFCGTLYAMTLTGVRWLGAITPIGGVSLLVGWAALIAAAAGLGR